MRLIDKFKKSNKPLQRSKLSELDEDILELLNDKFKPKQIHEYIIAHMKISITQRRVYQYIKELQSRDNPLSTPVVATTAPTKVTTSSTAKPAVASSDTTVQQPKQRPPLGTRKMTMEDAETALKPATETNVKYYEPGEFERKHFGGVIFK